VWCWPTGSHTTLVNAIKQKICFKPILSIFNPKLPLTVYTDASRDGYAGILVQLSDNREKPIAFFSKQTTSPEKNYHSFELELLAIVKTLEKFRIYLTGHHFSVITNCNAVKNALTKQTTIPQIARWVLSLQDVSFTIQYKAGSEMRKTWMCEVGIFQKIPTQIKY
jgi:hypothetical protein